MKRVEILLKQEGVSPSLHPGLIDKIADEAMDYAESFTQDVMKETLKL